MQTFHTVRVKVLQVVREFVKEEEGASAAEYALFLTLITLALVASVGALDTAIQASLNGAAAVIAPS